MNRFQLPCKLLFLISVLFIPVVGFTQITSNASGTIPTEYSSGPQDNIYVFCGAKGDLNASLTATLPAGQTGTFEWQKYNAATGTFDFFSSDVSGNTTSTISNLSDGCYRVKETTAAGDIFFTAWAFNNYIKATAEIPQSDCNSFTLKGVFDSPILTYTDLPTGQPKEVVKNIQVKWMEGSTLVSSILVSQVYTPPTKDTNYSLEVSDRFGCTVKADVIYTSIVTKASFDYTIVGQDAGHKSDPNRIEAPLTIKFTNTSENGTAGQYEWFIFNDLQKIKQEIKNKTFTDSIMVVLHDDSPIYIFQETGTYKVKLVSKKISELTTCTDTFYMSGYIVADSSFIEAPNVITPGDGDGENDVFAVKFFSMKTVKISIFNRWGKVLHVWESNNVQGFYNTATSIPASVWDGKVGGRLATPGVYYYVAQGIGRDGRKRSASGFFHLFRRM